MTMNKSNTKNGEKIHLRDYISQIVFLGVLFTLVAFLYFIFPQFWKNHRIFVSLIAIGLGMPALFSLWKFWAGYGWQVGIAPGLVLILMGVFIWFFGYDSGALSIDTVSNLFWMNVSFLAIWLMLVLFAFRNQPRKEVWQGHRKGEVWRDFRWIIAPAVIILLFLFDTSWAQSTLSISSMSKSIIKTTLSDTLELYAEYPSKILFDDVDETKIHIWTPHSFDRAEQLTVEVSATPENKLIFALKPQPDEPVAWHSQQNFTLNKNTSAITLLVQLVDQQAIDSQSVQLKLSSNNTNLNTSDWTTIIESKHDSQIREWKKNFLETGGIVVSLITAVFAGVKQLEDEKKRKRSEEINQAIDNFDNDMKNDFPKALENYLILARDWGEWENLIQNKFVNKVTDFLDSEKLWDSLLDKNITELTTIVEQFLKLSRLIQLETAPISEQFNLLNESLQQDVSAMLTLLKDHQQSIVVVMKITSALPDELRKKIPDKYKNEFPQQINALGFLTSESYPLQNQFPYYAKQYLSGDRLTMWLQAHHLDYSPFADAQNPFYSVLDKKLLIDFATSGFTFPTPDLLNATFGFSSSWDAGAALFDYCKTLQSNIKIKEDVFFVPLTSSMVENYGANHPQKILLHALAEQWIWSFAETPTLFYSLKNTQRDLLGRLLRWHNLLPVITANQVIERFQSGREEKSTKALLLKIREWLSNSDSTDLQMEEINALIGLRPWPKRHTFFLISTIDLNPHVERQIFPEVHEKLDEKTEWLRSHDCSFVHFLIDDKKRQTIPQSSLITQCKIRIQKCSKGTVEAFDLLFIPHDKEPADSILAKKANGSPGKMVRLGQKLLLQHVEKPSPEKDLDIENLIALE